MKKIFVAAACIFIFGGNALYAYAGEDMEDVPDHLNGLGKSIDTFTIKYRHKGPIGGEDKERTGDSLGVHVRVLPFHVGEADVGFYGKATHGDVKTLNTTNSSRSDTEYDNWAVGISGKYRGTDSSYFAGDLGLHFQDTHSDWKDGFSDQRDTSVELNPSYANWDRRRAGEAWLPKYEVGLWALLPISTEYSDSKGRDDSYAYDNQEIQLYFKQDLYDWYLDGEKNWRITPTLDLSIGDSRGKDSLYFGAGVGATTAIMENEVFEVGLDLRKYVEGDGSYWGFGADIKPANLVMSLIALQTKEYTPRDQKPVE